MPNKAIPALGDAPDITSKLVREEFPLPRGRSPLIAAVERILSGGGVQKLVIEMGKPIKVLRRVRAELPGEEAPEELYEDDMMAAVMNTEIQDFIFTEQLSPYEYLFRAFGSLSRKHLIPRCILGNLNQLKTWLHVDELTEIYGVEIRQHKEIPDGVMLLVGAKADEPDIIVHSLRLDMNH